MELFIGYNESKTSVSIVVLVNTKFLHIDICQKKSTKMVFTQGIGVLKKTHTSQMWWWQQKIFKRVIFCASYEWGIWPINEERGWKNHGKSGYNHDEGKTGWDKG